MRHLHAKTSRDDVLTLSFHLSASRVTQCVIGSSFFHIGATYEDIVLNTDLFMVIYITVIYKYIYIVCTLYLLNRLITPEYR